MELNAFTRAIRPTPKTRDFYSEAMSRIERRLKTEGFENPEEVDVAVLEEELARAETEIETLLGIESQVKNISDNFDTMCDRDMVSALNSIEEVFSPSEVSLATEYFTPTAIRRKGRLATEAMDGRVKFALIAIVITALLKAIAWLIEAITKQIRAAKKLKRKSKDGLTPSQEKAEEEINELAKDRAAEQVARKYSINSEIVREQMMRLYNYPSEGNLRQAGGRGVGAAAEVASLIVDKVNALDTDERTKERVRDGAFKCIFALLDNNVPIGHFAFNEATRNILADDFVEFAQRGFQGPISTLMSASANLLPDKEDAYAMWYKDPDFMENRVRLMTRHVGEDILSYLDNMEYVSRDLKRFFNNFGKSNDFDFDSAEVAKFNSFALNQKVKFANEVDYNTFVSRVVELLKECSFQPTTTSAVSTPMKFDQDVKLQAVQADKGIYYDYPDDGGTKYVGVQEYTAITSYLNSLSGEDAVATFAKWFYRHHGDYDKYDTIESRLGYLVGGYMDNQNQVRDQLRAIKRDFEDLLTQVKNVRLSREQNPAPVLNRFQMPTYVYDVEVPYAQTQMRLKSGGVSDHTLTRPLGKRVEGLIKNYRDSLKGWQALIKTTDKYVAIANAIDLER
jgi:uncharacterized protein (UPF0297 family)